MQTNKASKPSRRSGPASQDTPRTPPTFTARKSIVADPASYTPDEVRTFRGELGLSQSVFAELLGVSKSLVEHWERGVRPPSPTVRRLLDALRTAPASILSQISIDQPVKPTQVHGRRGASSR